MDGLSPGPDVVAVVSLRAIALARATGSSGRVSAMVFPAAEVSLTLTFFWGWACSLISVSPNNSKKERKVLRVVAAPRSLQPAVSERRAQSQYMEQYLQSTVWKLKRL